MTTQSIAGAKLDAARIHETSVIIDGRDPSHLLYEFTRDPKDEYIEIVRESGVTALVVDAAWMDDGFADAARSVASWYRRAEANPGMRVIGSVANINEAKANGEVGFILSFQGAKPFEDDPELVPMMARLNVRVVQLTYQARNSLGDGCGEKTDAGLSKLGHEFVHAFNEAGVVIDLSHAGERTALDAAAASAQPVIISHSNPRALCDHPRNISDELIDEVVKRGGLVGVSAFTTHIRKDGGETGVGIDEYMEHVDYFLERGGEDHVAIGLDVGELRSPEESHILHSRARGLTTPPTYRYVRELVTRRNFRQLTEQLCLRYSEEAVRKILGGNLLRVFDTVWSAGPA